MKHYLTFIFLLFFLIIPNSENFAQENDISFSEEEQKWISNQEVLRVANELDWPPFDFAEDNEPKGYSIDLIKLITEKTGLKIEFINGYSWQQLLTMFKKG
ncbi:MAG: transporter substrate-binding domain-containing protein, partial [Candidatus Ranarchaeia archaeon]